MGIETKSKTELKIDERIRKSLYKWIMHHPELLQSPIVNDFLTVKIDGHTELQLLPKLLLQFSVIDLHKNLFSAKIYSGLK